MLSDQRKRKGKGLKIMQCNRILMTRRHWTQQRS